MEDPTGDLSHHGQNSWSYVPHDHYKSTTQLVQLLVKIVARGGNFLLNIGPSPEGDWDDTAYARLKDMGSWLKVNGEGIYDSRPIRPWSSGNIYLTQSKDSLRVYAFYLSGGTAGGGAALREGAAAGGAALSAGTAVILPAEVTIEG